MSVIDSYPDLEQQDPSRLVAIARELEEEAEVLEWEIECRSKELRQTRAAIARVQTLHWRKTA